MRLAGFFSGGMHQILHQNYWPPRGWIVVTGLGIRRRQLRLASFSSLLVRGNQRLRNAHSDLPIVADSAWVERQEGIFIDVLREGLACCRMSFQKARLVLVNRFNQLVDQIVREIGSPDRKIIHSDGDIVLVQEAVSPSRDL